MKLIAILRILFCKKYLLITGDKDGRKSINRFPVGEITQSGNAIYLK